MTEPKTDSNNGSNIQQGEILDHLKSRFYRNFREQLGEDIVKEEQLQQIFENGMKEGSVIFVPLKRKQGIFGILNINTVIAGEKVSKNINIDNESEAAFLLGLQGSIDATKK